MTAVRRLRRWLGWLVATGLIGAAVLLTLLRLALPFAGEYRAEIEARVAAYLDVPVTIGDMQVEWHGLGPRLRLVDLRLSGPPPANAPVHFAEAWVDLGFAPGRDVPLRIRGLSLVGLEVDVRLNERGDLSLFGFTVPPERLIPHPERTPPPMVRQVLTWLARIERLQVLDAAVTITDPKGVQTRLPAIDLRLHNDGREHRVSASIALPEAYGERIRAVVAMEGTVENWPESSGRAWIDGTALDLAQLAALREGGSVVPTAGRADLSAWLDWQAGRLVEVLAEGRFDGLALAAAGRHAEGADSAVEFERLGGRVRWARTAAGDWQFDAGRLDVRRNGRDWPEGGLTVAHEQSAGLTRWHLGADFLRIEDIAGLARVLPLAPTAAERLNALAPRGDLAGFRAAGAGPERFELRTRFADLGWRPVDALPGASGVDGGAAFGADGGRIALTSQDAALAAPQLFTGDLTLSELEGGIEFVRDGDGAHVHAPDLRFANEDGSGSARIGVDLREQGGARLDIGVSVAGIDLAAVPHYLPDRLLGGGVVRGLDQALQGGRVTRGSLRLRGPAAEFPYGEGGDGEGGVFRIDADVRDATVAFAPDWPALEGLAGSLRFDGPTLEIAAREGALLGVPIDRLDVRIGDLREGRLTVSSVATARLDELQRVIEASPLARDNGFLAGAQVNGMAPIELELEVPLREPEATQVAGRLQLGGAELIQPRYDLDLRRIEGTLRFSRRGLETNGLRAQLQGRPITIRASLGQDYNTVRTTGRLALAQLVPDLPEALARRFNGAAPWRLQLRLPTGARGTPVLAGISTLRGTSVDLPAPLGKAAATERQLAFSLPLAGTGSGHTVRLDYGEGVRALVGLGGAPESPGLERATLHFGAGRVRLPEAPGVVVSGRTGRLDLGGWARLVHAAGRGTSGHAPPIELRRLDIEADAATGAGHILSGVRVRAVPVEAGGWSLDLESAEVTGRIRIPEKAGSGEPVRMRFGLIDFGLLKSVEPTASPTRAALEPRKLPAFDIRVARLKTREATLEQVQLVTAPARSGLNIHRLAFTNPHLKLEGQGRWRGGIDPRTELRLTATSGNLEHGLAGLGFPGAFVDGHGRVTVDLAWPGAPWKASIAALSGHADLKLADGLIPELDPGPARLLGLFSLRALPQMLSLNLRGLLRAGYAFDDITGRVDFAEGQAYTRNLVVEGPPGKMTISGRTGLIEQDYDQLIVFQPELSSSLPLIGALSGGPVTGLAVALIQGVLRNVGADAEKASELRYSLTGPWADPKVQRVNAPRSAPPEPPGSDMPRGR